MTVEQRLALVEKFFVDSERTRQLVWNDVIDIIHWVQDGNTSEKNPIIVKELQAMAKSKNLPVLDLTQITNQNSRAVTMIRNLDLNRMISELTNELGPDSEWVADVKEIKSLVDR